LFVGSDEIPSSSDAIERLKALGVTHVVNMAIEVNNPALDGQSVIGYKKIGIEDHPDQDVEKELREAVEFIGEHSHSKITTLQEPAQTIKISYSHMKITPHKKRYP
jgi:hypothetical protein